MLKLSGSILILAASFLAARQFCREYREHIAVWRAFYDSLLFIKSEILILRTPLPDVMGVLQEKGPQQLRALFAGVESKMKRDCTAEFGAIWKQAVSEAEVFARFGAGERALVETAGAYLGQADSGIAGERLALCIKEVEKKILDLEKKIAEKERIVRALSALAGILTILVLV